MLDASALIASMEGESGYVIADACISQGSAVSAINLAEVHQYLMHSGMDTAEARDRLDSYQLFVVPFDREIAHACGALEMATRDVGLGIADRACLATAAVHGFTAVTADQTWKTINVGIPIEFIR